MLFTLFVCPKVAAVGATDPVGAAGSPPNVFGSIAVPVRHSAFSARWQRVVRETSTPQLAGFVQPARYLTRDQQVRFVNASMNRHIRYRFDTDASGDRWATANETLVKRAGDCEDIVVAKMQALRMLGVSLDDLFMTIGHEGSPASVHALLLVRVANRFWVLDNRTDRLIAQESYPDFYPILTFSGSRTWVHGYRRGKVPSAVRAMALTASSRSLPLGNTMRSASSPAAQR